MSKILKDNPELEAYFNYLISNLENYQERIGSSHEYFISNSFAKINKKHLERLIFDGLFCKVYDEPDADFTGVKEEETVFAGYELTEHGKKIYNQLEKKDISLQRWLRLCYTITDTLKKNWLINLVPCWMYDGYLELVELYSQSNRKYHNLFHIASCLDEFESVHQFLNHPNEVEIALWYHDVIYNTKEKDNEEKSAELAEQRLSKAGLKPQFINNATTMILATKHNAIPDKLDAKFIVDIDLSILGKSEKEFDEYEKNIRREYDWVSEEQFRAGRFSILNGFMKREHIYLTDFFRQKYEAQARTNLESSLLRLK